MTEKAYSSKRLEELIEILEGKQVAVAQRIGVKQSHLSNMVNGKKNLSGEFLKKLSLGYPDVNINWLVSGEGDMFLPAQQHVNDVNEDGVVYSTPKKPMDISAVLEWIEKVEARIQHLESEVEGLRKKLDNLQKG